MNEILSSNILFFFQFSLLIFENYLVPCNRWNIKSFTIEYRIRYSNLRHSVYGCQIMEEYSPFEFVGPFSQRYSLVQRVSDEENLIIIETTYLIWWTKLILTLNSLSVSRKQSFKTIHGTKFQTRTSAQKDRLVSVTYHRRVLISRLCTLVNSWNNDHDAGYDKKHS